jgi:beta-glucosidase
MSQPNLQRLLLAAAIAFAPSYQLHAQVNEFSPRVKELVSKLTLDEKIALTHGTLDPADAGEAGYTASVPRLGIPALRWVDGPGGIDNRYDATTLPQVLSVAASFDPTVSSAFGDVVGKESRATHMDVFLGPMVNIARIPNWGRNLTSFGEDPFLTSALVVPMLRAIQDHGVMTTTKHFIANNQSVNVNGAGPDGGANFVVDPRTLHEIYLPGFEVSLAAGTTGVMAAYNRINGEFNAGNRATLTGILREQFKWPGFTVSDWGANHSTESILAGLDESMPGSGRPFPDFYGEALKKKIQSGEIPTAALDTAVSRLLTAMERFGMLNGTRVPAASSIDVEADAQIGRSIGAKGAVLLKNDGDILPLSQKSLASLAVIGPNAGQLAPSQGFGSAYGIESRRISPLEALKRLVPNGLNVTYAVGGDLTGEAIPSSALTPISGEGHGLTRDMLNGSPAQVDSKVEFVGANALEQGETYIWRGALSVQEAGTYLINIESWGGSTLLFFEGTRVAKSDMTPFGHGIPRKTSSLLPTTDGLDNGQFEVKLEAGKSYKIEIDGQAFPESAMQFRLAWVTPAMHRAQIEQAAAAAKAADTALLFVWQRGGETADNEGALDLPYHQNELVDAVAAANPRTIVVMNTAGPVAMPWKDKVKGILEMWYAGQEGGWATADVLLGKVNPAGKLPMTFPVTLTDSPAFAPDHPERMKGTKPELGAKAGNSIVYSEGIFVGYRHFDKENIEPLFPFGFGLSYTTFSYSALKATPGGDGIDVSFHVRNTGKVAGAEVAQVYLGPSEKPALAMAVWALSGFSRVYLEPGETQEVKIHIPVRQLQYWSVERNGWVTDAGRRTVFVGSSSRDLRLKGDVTISSN